MGSVFGKGPLSDRPYVHVNKLTLRIVANATGSDR